VTRFQWSLVPSQVRFPLTAGVNTERLLVLTFSLKSTKAAGSVSSIVLGLLKPYFVREGEVSLPVQAPCTYWWVFSDSPFGYPLRHQLYWRAGILSVGARRTSGPSKRIPFSSLPGHLDDPLRLQHVVFILRGKCVRRLSWSKHCHSRSRPSLWDYSNGTSYFRSGNTY